MAMHHLQPLPPRHAGLIVAPVMPMPQVLEPVIGSFAPDLIIVSAGYDAVQGDPLGGMNLTPQVRFIFALLHLLLLHILLHPGLLVISS